jgi:hypothetical protein
MRTVTAVLLRGVLAIAGFVGLALLLPVESLRYGAQDAPPPEAATVPILIVGYLMTAVGALLGAAYRYLQRLPGQTIPGLGALARDVFYSIDLWMGLVGSPVAFGLVLRSVDRVNVPGAIVLALENGFCCTMLVNTLLKPAPPQGAPP